VITNCPTLDGELQWAWPHEFCARTS